MADELKQTVSLTSYTVEKMSRHELINWVNSTSKCNHKKIEELCSGVAYCQMMELLFPNCIGLKKIRLNAKLEHEYLINLKLFQNAFNRLKFDKTVPIERILKGRFQDNFEFLQWFKKFYDTHATGKENPKLSSEDNGADRKPIALVPPIANKNQKSEALKDTEDLQNSGSVSPSSLNALLETQDQIQKQMQLAEKDRNFYYEKLRQIEDLLNDAIAKEENVEWSKRALVVLYATDGDAETEAAGDC